MLVCQMAMNGGSYVITIYRQGLHAYERTLRKRKPTEQVRLEEENTVTMAIKTAVVRPKDRDERNGKSKLDRKDSRDASSETSL